jgi:probable F420-dependent oxidoreductase
MPDRPFRFGIGVSSANTTEPRAMLERARLAESVGFSSLLISDHLLDQFAPLIALSAIAQMTSTLRLGTFVLNNDLRHPAVLAQELASLDLLSGGRLQIGIGAGWNLEEYEWMGLPFERHATRFARMSEAVHILKGLLGAGPLSFKGEYYQINQMDGRPKPRQKPHPPFLIGGGGKRMLTYAAQEAQIVGLAPRLPAPGKPDLRSVLAEATLEKVGWVRAAAGAAFDSLELNTYPCLGPVEVTDDALAAGRARADGLYQRYGVEFGVEELLDSPHVFIGTVDQLEQKCLGLRERFCISNILLLGDVVAFAPVVERLAGR